MNREERKAIKQKQREDYIANVINYNRVAAIELANRAKEKKPHEGAYVSIQNVHKIYDNLVQAVYDFSLDIKQNEFVEGRGTLEGNVKQACRTDSENQHRTVVALNPNR